MMYCFRSLFLLFVCSKGFPNSHDDESLAGPRSDFLGDFYGRYYQDVPLPESIDWAEKGAIGRVHNQGNIGCFACSVAGALEALNFIRTGTFVPLSAVHLHNIYAEYVKRRGDSFTGGGDHVEVFQCIIKFGGLLSENFYASMVEEIDFTDKTTMIRLK